jgi:calcineurin-like phosphoesterase family protein
MKVRDDIDIANTWVTSDTHYGHENIIAYCNRPEDVEQVMIAEWRKVAQPGRTMLHLGDLCYRGNARFKALIAKKELTGEGLADRNLLVSGNHDGQRYSFYRDCGFKLARPFALKLRLLEEDGTPGLRVNPPGLGLPSTYVTVSFSHYAWSEEEDGPQPANHWRVHGHIHNNGYYDGRADKDDQLVPYLRNHINVSVEVLNYRPVNLKALLDAAILGRLPGGTS